MSRVSLPALGVGNDFVRPSRAAGPAQQFSVAPVVATPAFSILDDLVLELEPAADKNRSPFGQIVELLHRFSIGAFALLLLMVASSAIQVAGIYKTNQLALNTPAGQIAPYNTARPQSGPNLIVPTADLNASLQKITTQHLSLDIGGKAVSVKPETIKSWLKVVSDKSVTSYIHVNQKLIDKSLHDTAAPFIKPAKNQISRVNPDGSSKIIATGQNGLKLANTAPTSQQIAKTLLGGKGFQLALPTESQTFAVSTVSDFDKLIEVNVTSKQMYLYQNGQLTKTYPISAGAVATPTLIGQFKIYEKLAVQDMRGYNANGTRYFQPHVRWVSYFSPGGYAIHGNYWRPKSWFGAVNSSHGCVSLPDSQAKEVYDWAPVGTTVITHT